MIEILLAILFMLVIFILYVLGLPPPRSFKRSIASMFMIVLIILSVIALLNSILHLSSTITKIITEPPNPEEACQNLIKQTLTLIGDKIINTLMEAILGIIIAIFMLTLKTLFRAS